MSDVKHTTKYVGNYKTFFCGIPYNLELDSQDWEVATCIKCLKYITQMKPTHFIEKQAVENCKKILLDLTYNKDFEEMIK